MLFTNDIYDEKKKAGKSLLDLKPSDWGEGTENTSEEIDSVLYGDLKTIN